MKRRSVTVNERGQTEVAQDTWAALSGDSDFRRLQERGIVTVTLLPTRRTRLEGSCYVGWAQCGDITLELREKVPGALRALLSYATNSAFKIEHTKSPASELGPLALLLIQQFLSAVAEYAAESREFIYERQQRAGSLVGGRIDIARSLQLRARGLRHLLVFEKNLVTFNTPLNRVVLAALVEVERLKKVVGLQEDDVARARGLAMVFSDCRDTEILFGDRARISRTASALAKSGQTARQRDIAALASALLAHESFELRTATWTEVPRSWFLNLENLFEQAVLARLRSLTSGSTRVSRGSERPRPIFRRKTGTYQAYPDIVVSYDDGRVTVGDVKYKNWTGAATASDIYQLLVHTSAFSGTISFLVYPHDEYEAVSLGTAATGTETWLFALDVRNLADSVGRLADTLGLQTRTGSIAPRPAGTTQVSGNTAT